VAVREGLGLVLSGSVATADRGFRFEIVGLEPVSGEPEFDFSALAANRESVLTAIGALSRSVREALGDRTVKRGETAIAETFTAASIEAAGTYMEAIELAYNGRHQEAIEKFRRATELDPNFGRAFSGWAVSEFKLGREADAEALWDRALSLMGTMTERERLRTLGVYYATVTRNYAKAVESFAELVEKYPADAAGRNNLAVSAFYALDFETAATESRRLLEMFPGSRLYRTNSALYAMYSSDFDAAAAQARVIIEDDPEYGSAYLPLAISLLATGDANGARDAYRRMMASATTSEHGESHAMLGLADLSIYVGDLEQARATLQDGIALDRERDAPTAAAIKYVALAATFLEETDRPMALAATRDALALSSQDSVKIAAALVFLEAGETQAAAATADELAPQLQTHNRAYGQMLRAAILRRADDHVAAIDLLRSALQLADLWRIRYELGRAYLEAGFFAEAFDEFENCYERRGEATAMFLDDTPTVRYLADLPYWTGRAQEGLGMATAAEQSYEAFVALQRSGPLAEDARKRLR
jgi:tetratricopeptide (TPR) repeat protein